MVSPSYGGKKQKCFELDMMEKIELGFLPTVDGLHLWLVSNLSYMVVLECGKVVLGWWNMIICFVLPKWCGCAEISCSLENMFHILMLQLNSIKTHQNLHVNIAIAYRENDVSSNV